MRRRSPLNQTLPRIATIAQKAAGFVTCPLCHMAEATMADGAVEKGGGWRCARMRSAMGRHTLGDSRCLCRMGGGA